MGATFFARFLAPDNTAPLMTRRKIRTQTPPDKIPSAIYLTRAHPRANVTDLKQSNDS